MFTHFSARHIPALIAGTSMTFGGLWPIFNARASLSGFGLPPRIADVPATRPVAVIGQWDVVDVIMAVTGSYAGLVDGYVVWREGGGVGKVWMRVVGSGVVAASGFWGLTVGGA
ncbi:Uu.00g094320.m01.CDS01 [Anthostomella pinea]|uniref:Uu.00g094320.m01.CDS01 n=1 Tax=Anthostomella pinea TaxID=933095 RepID=A0AAI8VPK3_9PEZI|nr:Uu.00g094320.m01.CDS01 [Anthostomella pinea]